MIRFKRKILLYLFISFSISAQAIGAEKRNIENIENTATERVGILASVDGDPITLLDVLKICGQDESRLPYMYQGEKLEEEVARVRLKALEEVINNKLVYDDFKKMKFKLPITYMQRYMDKIAESYNVNDQKSLREMLEARGQNYEEFKQEAYKNAAVQALISSRCYSDVFITPEKVYKYYKKNEGDFVSPKKLELQILKLKRNGMHKNQLDSLADTLAESFKNKDKQTFNEAVMMYSEGPETQNGGNIGWVDQEKLRTDFAKAIDHAEVGDIIGPIKAREAYYFIRIAGEKSAIVESFKDAKDGIREKLMREKKKEQYKKFIDSLRSNASINFFVNH